jgi:hypothetical protein
LAAPAAPAVALAAGDVAGWFAAASRYLNRRRLECAEHGVAHTGKLARSIVLDLALWRATGQSEYLRLAVERARYVVARLAPDPDHGGYVYLPGRLDPRNCSTSAIDSGECTDALSRLLAGATADAFPPGERCAIEQAVERNAETYLRQAVIEKEITNQRLWGAMGLASAQRVMPRPAWRDALRLAVARSCAEQGPDGSWPYHPDPAAYGVHAGAADTTVYYHSRCLAFLFHIGDAVPELDEGGSITRSLERGLAFLAAVIAPDGLKPLALEGKRWFWDGSYEAGSNAYDVYALLRGAARFQRGEWRALALRCWRRLAAHQDADGGITACRDPGVADFVCRDFHTADLAWPAQVMELLGGTEEEPAPAETGAHLAGAGIVRLQSRDAVAIIRTGKAPRNTLFGGAIGGGALAYAGGGGDWRNRIAVAREGALVEANFLVAPRHPRQGEAVRRFWRDNPPWREGRQWLFVVRLLLRRGRLRAAASRLWRGYLQPFGASLSDAAASHWALSSEVTLEPHGARILSRPARPDGSVPDWLDGATVTRAYALRGRGCLVSDRLDVAAPSGAPMPVTAVGRVAYLLPSGAQEAAVDCSEPVRRRGRGGRLVEVWPSRLPFWLQVSYRL